MHRTDELRTPEGSFEPNRPLAPLTTLQVGGAARFFLSVDDEAAAAAALEVARAARLKVFVLGGGSNLLVAEGGFDGLVLRYNGCGTRIVSEEDKSVLVEVGAGLEWDGLVGWATAQGLAGVSCLSGIPGRVGAAPIQNIGAYGQEVSEVVEEVRAIDRATGKIQTFAGHECDFGYRWSRFKGPSKDRFLITRVTLRLRREATEALRYEELRRHLGGRDAAPPEEARRAVLEIRRRKSMVYDPSDPNHRSAGSFFVNPVVDPQAADAVYDRARALLGEDVKMPRYPAAKGMTKLSAAWLIEGSGFTKGHTRGRAGLSSKHCLALINRGGASADDLIGLAEEIRDEVLRRFGVRLHPEPVLLGAEFSPAP